MCGICGKLEYDSAARVEPGVLNRMMAAVHHRGPDGNGTYFSGPVGLGHTRLSIIDLNNGAQPLSNEDGTVWLVFNGEIYNFQELRSELMAKGHRFRTETDSEVLVHLYEEYGVGGLSQLQGMFAYAIWDQREGTLFLARDRIGIKPLYYHDTGSAFLFGSEIKAILAHPGIDRQLEPRAVDSFLTHLCLPGRETLWKGIYKLEPGYYLMVRKGRVTRHRYWDLKFAQTFRGSFRDASDELRVMTRRTVRSHMISDVPVGFLLSGGVDSSVVLACAAGQTNRKLSTFTVGFEKARFEDERPYARLVAERFGTAHHEITVTPREFWDFLPSLVWHMEEPVCDPPAVSLHFVSKLARPQVKVLLSGEGGDEAFGGYNDYRNFLALERVKSFFPSFRGAFAAGLNLAGKTGRFHKVAKFAPYFVNKPQNYYYSRVASPFSYFSRNRELLYSRDFLESVPHGASLEVIRDLFERMEGQPLLNQLQYLDTKTSLPEDLLIKADRITMANALELRVPFLDHKMLEFAAGLPPGFRVKGLQTKRVLKSAFAGEIPRAVIRRPKAGFPLPLDQWMRIDLKNAIREVLLSGSSLGRGIFCRSGVEKLLADSDAGRPVAKEVFSLLTLELLLARFEDQPACRPNPVGIAPAFTPVPAA